MKKPVKAAIIAVSGIAALSLAAVGIMSGVYYSIASGEFSTAADSTVILSGEEPVYSIGRLRTGLSLSAENMKIICGGRLRMDPVSSVMGIHSATELTVLELYPDAGVTELIARTKALEDGRSDQELMELYCSTAYFGNGICGADNAAAFYFGKKPETLTAEEAGVLADICRSKRLQGMSKAEIAEEYGSVSFAAQDIRTADGSYYAQLLDELYSILDGLGYSGSEQTELVYGGELIINSTMDVKVQSALDKEITEKPAMRHFQLAMQVSDYSGAVLGCTGGASDGTTLNRCAIPRSPGSSIKPLSVYSPALEDGLTTWSGFIPDKPDEMNWPQNYNGEFEGEVMTSYALRQSKNTCAVYLEKLLGGDTCLEFLRKLGFSSLLQGDNVPIGMGMGYLIEGVTPAEMAAAYQIFGNGGSYTPPHYINSITTRDGKTLYTWEAQTEQVISPETSWIMNRMLLSNVTMEDGLGKKAAIDGIEVIGKTGTRDNTNEVVTDNWFVGGTADMCAALWIGCDDSEQLIQEGSYPGTASVWNSVISEVQPERTEFTPCGNTWSAVICQESGGVAAEGCTNTETGWFADGTLPDKCGKHG